LAPEVSQSGETEAAAAVEPAAPTPPLRERVLAFIRERIGSAGHAVINVREIAAHLGAKPEAVTYHVRNLARAGVLSTKRAGPKGTVFRLAEGAQARGRARPAAAGPRTARRAAAGRVSTSAYCPWCGQKAGKGWRYCAACGEQLP
jgi:DNA-binding transcriptional ArsR family regulator